MPVIERLLAPRLIIERVICRYIHGKTHRAYFSWDQILYLPCSSTVQLILKKDVCWLCWTELDIERLFHSIVLIPIDH